MNLGVLTNRLLLSSSRPSRAQYGGRTDGRTDGRLTLGLLTDVAVARLGALVVVPLPRQVQVVVVGEHGTQGLTCRHRRAQPIIRLGHTHTHTHAHTYYTYIFRGFSRRFYPQRLTSTFVKGRETIYL